MGIGVNSICNLFAFSLFLLINKLKRGGGRECNLTAHYLPMKLYLNDSKEIAQGDVESLQEPGKKSEKQDKATFSNEN